MQTERTFIDDLKHQYKHGGMAMRLIFINVAIFLIIRILNVFLGLGVMAENQFLQEIATPILCLYTDFTGFITHPWGLFTSMFAHYDFFHLLFNMVFLYFSGRLFEQIFDQKRLLYTYLLGGILGGLLEILAHGLLPKMGLLSGTVLGASGSITAIFVAIAFYKPNLKVNFFGVFPVRIIILALIFILKDLLSLGAADNVAHFAHLGGAILGVLSIQNVHSSTNIINVVQQFGDRLIAFFARGKGARMRVKRGGRKKSSNARTKTDEEYNMEAKQKQERIDIILDKISKSGYESLTKKEKDFLFNQSKNG